MNFYFDAAKTLDRLDARQGSVKGVIATLPEKTRKRTGALIIETLKCMPPALTDNLPAQAEMQRLDKTPLTDVIQKAQLLKEEKKIKSQNLALVLVHDLLLAGGIQAGDGPIKQAILRHKTRLNAEFTKHKVRKGATNNQDLTRGDIRACRSLCC